jgi:hypothetical protein
MVLAMQKTIPAGCFAWKWTGKACAIGKPSLSESTGKERLILARHRTVCAGTGGQEKEGACGAKKSEPKPAF